MIVLTWQYPCFTAQLPNSILTDKVTGKRVKKKWVMVYKLHSFAFVLKQNNEVTLMQRKLSEEIKAIGENES